VHLCVCWRVCGSVVRYGGIFVVCVFMCVYGVCMRLWCVFVHVCGGCVCMYVQNYSLRLVLLCCWPSGTISNCTGSVGVQQTTVT